MERAKSLSLKNLENERRLKEMELEVSTAKVRGDELRKREMTAGDDKRRLEQQVAALKSEVGQCRLTPGFRC